MNALCFGGVKGNHMGIKLPRVTIEFQEESPDTIGKISFGFVLGFALRLFWPFLAILGEFTFGDADAAEYIPILNLASVCAFGLTMLAYGFFLEQLRNLFSTPKKRDFNRLVAALIIVLGVILIVLSNMQPLVALPLLIIAGVLTGIGSAMLMMSYGVSASICDAASVGLSAALAFAIALALYAIVSCTCQGNPAFCCALAALVPFIEWICLHESSKHLIDRLKFADITMPVRMGPFLLHISLPCLLFGLALAACRLQMMSLSNMGNLDTSCGMILGAVVAGLCIVVAVLTQRQNSNFMMRVLTPLIAGGLLVLAIVDLEGTPSYGFLFTCFYIFIACSVWVTLSDVSQRFRISAFTVFGFGYGTLLIGETVTFAIGAMGEPANIIISQSPYLTAVLFFLLTTGTALLPRDSELRRTLIRGKSCPRLTRADIEKELFFIQEPDADDTAAAADGAGVDAASDAVSAGQVIDATVTQNNAAQDEHDALEHDAATAEETDGPLGKKGRYKRKCAIVADTYLLSRKETEVLFLLAKGRNAAAIQEALYIAAGTVNTHMRHIYRKLDVHSQQELIALVESVEVDDEF